MAHPPRRQRQPVVSSPASELASLGEDRVLELGLRLGVDRLVDPVAAGVAHLPEHRDLQAVGAQARSRIRTWTLRRSSGCPAGWYQSVMIRPPNGSAEASGMKSSVSSVARQR